MKPLSTSIFILMASLVFGQKMTLDPKMLEMGWNFVSPLVINKVEDPLTKEIITKTIPKIIREDVKGAAYEIGDAIYRIKNVKVLNKEYLIQQESSITVALSAIKHKDYAKAVNEMATLVAITDRYIKSGLLDKEEAKPSGIDNNIEANLVKNEEINGKVVIEKNSSYYFFIPNGTVSEIQSKDTTLTKFRFNSNSGRYFEIGIVKQQVDEENWSIDYLEKNPSFRDSWINIISTNVLKDKFGDGIASPASFVSTQNFKAYKLPYIATSDASMTTTFLTFHNANIYLIYFKSSQADFPANYKEFEEITNMFFFGEPLPFCQIKKIGKINIINKSLNPYDLYKNEEFITTINGKSEYKLNVAVGVTYLKATQKSGYMLYPTENKRTVNIKTSCQDATVEIGFEDKK
ncbi:MAG: hypothetical protein IT238_03575 [Bacteroidia bacterium]|nr:hypothetical protein [Bacteroidia bacterium]MCZ2247842.1 hypothetical protein [Bacteroidia bacterium]